MSPRRPVALGPDSRGDLAAPSPRAKPHVCGERCYEGPRGSLIWWDMPVAAARLPSKHLVYIMYSLYSLRLGCCLQYRNRIGLLTLTDAVNQSLSLRLDAAQRTIRSVMPRIMCFLAVFSTVFALLFPHGKICKNILVAHVF